VKNHGKGTVLPVSSYHAYSYQLDQLQEGDEAADGQADQCQETQDRGQPPVYVGFHS
jgi:hypothetical protein